MTKVIIKQVKVNASVTVAGVWMVIADPIPVLNKLYVYGVLELEYLPDANGIYRDFRLVHFVHSGCV